MRAIDLYSGIGGWGLGLAMAGIEVVASYDIWRQANETKQKNSEAGWYGGSVTEVDIRKIEFNSLPEQIDVVVGSPPCTQFSYSNRGGNGDIHEGLTDIEKFLEIVEYLNPRYWAMENVPRVRRVLEQHISERDGRLRRFQHLFDGDSAFIQVLDMSDFGLPQRRKRCIAGNLPIEFLSSYAEVCPQRTLGEVLKAFEAAEIHDPIYGFLVDRSRWFDHMPEVALTREEIRLNHDNKRFHPVYNDMAFPDEMDRPVRAITATCTRVSRESIVIKDHKKSGRLRRLTIRERASLQGFPVTFQFHGQSYASKLRMIGNAMPPLVAYYIGCAMLGVSVENLAHPNELAVDASETLTPPPVTKTDGSGRSFPTNRRFRAAIPNLRFKSGVRFEFSNSFTEGGVRWSVRFLFGTPKNILELPLDRSLVDEVAKTGILKDLPSDIWQGVSDGLNSIVCIQSGSLQSVWTRKEKGVGPHDVVDRLGQLAKILHRNLTPNPLEFSVNLIERILDERSVSVTPEPDSNGGRRMDKIVENVSWVLSGMILGAMYNALIDVEPSRVETLLERWSNEESDYPQFVCRQRLSEQEDLFA